MTDQRECANPDLNEYLCPTCDHPCAHVASTLFDFTPSTRTTRQPFNPNTAHWGFPPLDWFVAKDDLRIAGLMS